mgnify:CR=1 FL=1
MKNDFLIAITQLSAEKNLPKEVVIEAVEAALASAFKREANETGPNITVKVNPASGEVLVYTMKNVVETVEDAKVELTLDEARVFDKKAQIGHTVAIETTPKNAGRIAAQTAKQVVMQRLREAEREVVFAEFVGREGDIVSGIIQRIEPKQIIIDLGKTEAILPSTEQIRTEHYRPGQRLKVYLHEVFRSGRGPQVVVSRTHRNLVRRLFELEVPEIFNGTVEIKSIAREPGFRSKVAVAARQEGVDAVGACVGLRGIRIQNIINELSGEKIDVIEWHPDASVFVANALSPAPVVSVSVNEDEKTAAVVVPDRQLSLAIGREGQNARLAAKLTGWRIDIKSASAAEVDRLARAEEEAARAAEAALLAPPVVEEPMQEPAAEPLAPAARIDQAPPVAPADTWVLPPAPAPVTAGVVPLHLPLHVAEPAPVAIRFAEEIFPAAAPIVVGGKPDKKGKGKKTRDDEGVAAAAAAKVKKAKRSSGRPVYEEEEDDELEEYPDLIRVPRR